MGGYFGDLHEKTLYVVPETPSGLVEQSSSMSAHAVLDADGATVLVTVAVAAPEAVALARRLSALLALFASTPVPAARPTTAADNRAMMAHRIKTKALQPHSVRFRWPPGDEEAPAAVCEEWYGRGEIWSTWLAL